ncbi:MAG TPA: hypothetical protein VNI20_08680 [Fimbriimonadaceae bacterium]|nr:hypothetical protein [Fimbriimonadaceae bacterium]
MSALIAMLGLALGAQAQEQVPSMNLWYPGAESTSVGLLDAGGCKKVWEFKIKGREAFLDLLSHLHSRDAEVYEVTWGVEDVLRIEARPSPLGDEPFEHMLRNVLNSLDLTYRSGSGILTVFPKPNTAMPEGFGQNDYWAQQHMLGHRSLDDLARFLSSVGRGYRVDHTAGKAIWLTAPFVDWNQLKWIVSELDPGLKIDDRHDMVLIRKR